MEKFIIWIILLAIVYLIGITGTLMFFIRCRKQSEIMPKPITNENTITFGEKNYTINDLKLMMESGLFDDNE